MTLPAHLGYLALALLVGGESLGLLVPGETALLAAGILARGAASNWVSFSRSERSRPSPETTSGI